MQFSKFGNVCACYTATPFFFFKTSEALCVAKSSPFPLSMIGYVWVVAYTYGLHRHGSQRKIFDEKDAQMVAEILEEECKELPESHKWNATKEFPDFKCIGAAKVRLGQVSGSFTTWSEEELVLHRYHKKPVDFCTLDVIDFYPCSETWTISTRQGSKNHKACLRPLNFKHSQPLFVAGTDLSNVEVRVNGEAQLISNLVGHNEAIPCSILCKPLGDLLKFALIR